MANDKSFKYTFEMKKAISDDKVYIYGVASTSDIDRDNDAIDIGSLDSAFDKYLSSNPALLYNHDTDKIIGKVLSVHKQYQSGVVDDQLRVVAVLSDTVDKDVKTQILEGSLKSFSIGGRGRVVNKRLTITDLYEVSVVPIGANRDALFDVVKSICTGSNCDNIKGDEFMVNEVEIEMIVEKAVKAVKADMEVTNEQDVVKGLQETIVALTAEIDDMKATKVSKGIVET